MASAIHLPQVSYRPRTAMAAGQLSPTRQTTFVLGELLLTNA
jgi:hypothetical protein